ncbi:superoxide dismutase family protein [Streptomyces sp. XD-27]|uniref:superoxide dismutase family protein n=1 Tax=Streptomyces sp. XD-27 TaxID=3062779 RepID=UPI0026F42ED7|nr:superoxide dismutase family protein [Streptomyces sp. XD-27]WKX70099.1 superoxide dismutase family protein [Streptomyces sp. XD-27]
MTVLAVSMASVSAVSGAQCPVAFVHERYATVAEGAHEAVTYDAAAVPAGSAVTVLEHPVPGGGTRIVLRVHGVEAHRTFGAHVHTKACGAQPADSGPHYQNVPDPVQPSTDPAYANARNEVWLDLTTDARGNGRAEAVVDWRFRDQGARSVVVHEHATETHEGHAGTAGARLACVNVPFA